MKVSKYGIHLSASPIAAGLPMSHSDLLFLSPLIRLGALIRFTRSTHTVAKVSNVTLFWIHTELGKVQLEFEFVSLTTKLAMTYHWKAICLTWLQLHSLHPKLSNYILY